MFKSIQSLVPAVWILPTNLISCIARCICVLFAVVLAICVCADHLQAFKRHARQQNECDTSVSEEWRSVWWRSVNDSLQTGKWHVSQETSQRACDLLKPINQQPQLGMRFSRMCTAAFAEGGWSEEKVVLMDTPEAQVHTAEKPLKKRIKQRGTCTRGKKWYTGYLFSASMVHVHAFVFTLVQMQQHWQGVLFPWRLREKHVVFYFYLTPQW